MAVPVMEIRIVRVAVRQPVMPVPLRVWFARRAVMVLLEQPRVHFVQWDFEQPRQDPCYVPISALGNRK